MRNMKDSGIEWIGKIPDNWQVRKLPSFCEINIGLTHTPKYIDDGIPFLSVKDISGNEIDLSNTKFVSKEEYEKMPIGAKPKKGDLLFGRVCTLGVPKIIDFDDEICIFVSLGYLRFKNENIAMKKYIVHWMNSELFNQEVQRFINGSTQQNLNTRWMNNFYVLLPPVIEQELIANYLDNKVKEIDNIISKTQETIKEYKKYKQSVITEAVTKGLNANVEMKDSGIEWIGEIPKHWDCIKFRRCTVLKQGLQIAQSNRYYEVAENRYIYITLKYINSKSKDNIEYIENPDIGVMCDADDILFVRTGSTGLVVTGISGVFHNNFFKVIYDKQYLTKEYLLYYLNQSKLQEHFSLLAGTTTIPDLNHGDFLETKVIIPPIKEQIIICDYLKNKLLKIDNLIEKKQELINQLESYKKSLIYEYVTGKKEVDVAYGY